MTNDISWLKNLPIAHRGLHSLEAGIPENSIKAFINAAEKGFAIELDVYVNYKGQVVVFHDESLKRMCGYDKSIFAYDADKHKDYYKLLGTDQTIPTLSDVFKTINNSVPIIIHIRERRIKKRNEIYKAIYDVLNSYRKQRVAIQSFDPILLGIFVKKLPNVIRGQLSSNLKNEKLNRLIKYFLSNYKLNWYSKPHYIAHDFSDSRMPKSFFQKQNKKGLPILCWIITSLEEHERAVKIFDNIIFEGFIPNGYDLNAEESQNIKMPIQ